MGFGNTAIMSCVAIGSKLGLITHPIRVHFGSNMERSGKNMLEKTSHIYIGKINLNCI